MKKCRSLAHCCGPDYKSCGIEYSCDDYSPEVTTVKRTFTIELDSIDSKEWLSTSAIKDALRKHLVRPHVSGIKVMEIKRKLKQNTGP